MRIANWKCGSCALLSLLIIVPELHATLGEIWRAPSLKKQERSTLNSQSFAQYDVHELTHADGSKIREYTDKNKMVFAASWEGRRHPELTEILGSHYPAFHLLVDKTGRKRQPVFIQSGSLKVLIGGHQRDFRGQAILDDLVPAGVKAQELK